MTEYIKTCTKDSCYNTLKMSVYDCVCRRKTVGKVTGNVKLHITLTYNKAIKD